MTRYTEARQQHQIAISQAALNKTVEGPDGHSSATALSTMSPTNNPKKRKRLIEDDEDYIDTDMPTVPQNLKSGEKEVKLSLFAIGDKLPEDNEDDDNKDEDLERSPTASELEYCSIPTAMRLLPTPMVHQGK